MLSNQFYPKKGRRPYMDSFSYGVSNTALPACCLWSLPSACAWLVSAQAEAGKGKAKLKRRKETNLLSKSNALLSGIPLCCCVRTETHGTSESKHCSMGTPLPCSHPTVPYKRWTVSALHPNISQRIKQKRSCRNCLLVTKQQVRD